MQRRAFIKLCSLAAVAPTFGIGFVRRDASIHGVNKSGTPTSGNVRLAYGRDDRGFELHSVDGVVRGVDGVVLALREHAHPVAVTSAKDGRIAVVDAAHGCVELFTANGTALCTIGRDALKQPRDVAFADDGTLVVADAHAHRIIGFDALGTQRFSFGRLGTSGPWLNGPSSIAIGPDGLIHVADRGNRRVVSFERDGTRVAELGHNGEFLSPRAITCDTAGRLYVADALRSDVQVFESGERIDRIALERTPLDVAIKPDGALYIALAGRSTTGISEPRRMSHAPCDVVSQWS